MTASASLARRRASSSGHFADPGPLHGFGALLPLQDGDLPEEGVVHGQPPHEGGFALPLPQAHQHRHHVELAARPEGPVDAAGENQAADLPGIGGVRRAEIPDEHLLQAGLPVPPQGRDRLPHRVIGLQVEGDLQRVGQLFRVVQAIDALDVQPQGGLEVLGPALGPVPPASAIPARGSAR